VLLNSISSEACCPDGTEKKQKQNLTFMNREKIESSLIDLNQLVIGGRLMDAFEKYYHDDVSMQENENSPVLGKAANRLRELEFLSNVVEFKEACVKNMAVGNDVSFVEWTYDYTHKEWGVRKYRQVSVQHWKDGKIIKEQFFYSN
jgi:hypothetical protein